MIPGACLCGALQYEVDALGPALVHCHCARCRKHHGAPFASFVTAPADALRWVRGEASVHAHASTFPRVRRSCATCGSVAPTAVGDDVLVPAGNLQGELGVPAGRHVFVGADDPGPGRCVEEVVPGSCLCGAVAFAVRGLPAKWYQCHCSRCRRARSAAHGSNTFYPAAQFTWRTGRELVRGYRPPDADRFTTSFCTTCGGGAPTVRDGVPFALVPAGLLDADLGRRADAHIHVASRAPWYEPSDDLPRFPELPPA